MVLKIFDKNGMPLKITAEWTDDDYYFRVDKDSDDLRCENVQGWLVRINGVKFPRPREMNDDDGEYMDWSYRYTPQTPSASDKGKSIAIGEALIEYHRELS